MPFMPIVLLPIPEKYLIMYNSFLCHLVYIPISILLTVTFTVFNILMVPLAYFGHTITLIQTITNSDETMDEFEEKLERAFTIVKFIFISPALLLISVFTDAYKFWRNLYS